MFSKSFRWLARLAVICLVAVAFPIVSPSPAHAAVGDITTIAGTGPGSSPSGNGGPAIAATLGGVWDLESDAQGNIYLMDLDANEIRRIDPSGTINAVVDLQTFYEPQSLATDSIGNLYIAEWNGRIRKRDTTGTVSAFAGFGGGVGSWVDGQPAIEADIGTAGDMEAHDSGDLFVTDNGGPQRIGRIDASGRIWTVAGGSGEFGVPGDGGPATSAWFDQIYDMEFGPDGNLYVMDGPRIRMINGEGIISEVFNLRMFHSSWLTQMEIDNSGNFYFLLHGENSIMRMDSSGSFVRMVGNGRAGFSGDNGPSHKAELSEPQSIYVDPSGNLLIADKGNYRVRRIDSPSSVPMFQQIIPEGTIEPGYSSFLLLTNPNQGETVEAFITYLTPDGPRAWPGWYGLTIQPGKRTTISLNADPALICEWPSCATGEGSTDETEIATRVVSLGTPLFAEISVHTAFPTEFVELDDGSTVVLPRMMANLQMSADSQPRDNWFLPEGATHSGFTTHISIANPNLLVDSKVDVDYLTKSGLIAGPRNFLVPRGGRKTLNVNAPPHEGGCGCQDDVSTLVSVADGLPGIVAGVAVYKYMGDPYSGDLAIGGSLGITEAQDTWVVPEGATHSGWTSFVLVANPGLTTSTVQATYLTGSQGAKNGGTIQIPPQSRKTINVNSELQRLGANPDDVSTVIDRTAGPLVAVESSIQKAGPSGFVIADSIGEGAASISTASSTKWMAAEGATHSGFSTFILIANPSNTAASVKVSFLTPAGQVTGPSLNIPAQSRRTVSVNNHLPGSDVSTLVEATSGKVVVEMSIDRVDPAMGFSKGRNKGQRVT